jgi:hypothetical protein
MYNNIHTELGHKDEALLKIFIFKKQLNDQIFEERNVSSCSVYCFDETIEK